jgi:ATP-dependent protease ClpP protease subunit
MVLSYIVNMIGGFVFFRSFFSVLSIMLLPSAAAVASADFTNNTNKKVFSQTTGDVTCQSVECRQKLSATKDTIVLSENTIILRGEVDGNSVSKTISALMTTQGDTVNLFLSSPGGSVVDGAQLIQAIRSVNKKVVCVTDFSASMSFVILQACDERVVLESSILMQHVPSFGVRHQQQPNAVSFVEFLKQMTNTIDAAQAKRMELPLERFKQLVRDDYWLFGRKAVEAKAADRVAQTICSPELTNKEEKETFSAFGGLIKINVIWSKCPLVTEPKSVEIARLGTLTQAQEEKLQKQLTRMLDYKADARRMIDEAMGFKKDSE